MHNAAVIAAGNQAGTPNYDKAFRWFKAAAERGLHDSQFNLAVLYERGLGTRVDTKEAFFWYTLAAKQGDGDAAKRADKLAKTLTGPDATELSKHASPHGRRLPVADEANVVALTDPAVERANPPKRQPEATVTGSSTAVPALIEASIRMRHVGSDL